MRSAIRRFVVAGCAVGAFTAATAPAALAATAHTSPATNVTANAARLTGQVGTGGLITLWQFQYGKTTNYGSSTPIRTIPAGNGSVPVSFRVTGLKPATRYHFRLVAVSYQPNGYGYYYRLPAFGGDVSLVTPGAGHMILPARKIKVRHGKAAVPLGCASTITCRGRLSIKVKLSTGTRPTLTCVSTRFTIGARRTRTLHPRLSRNCRTLLQFAKHHRFGARLTVRTTSGQRGLSKHVTVMKG